MNTRTASAPAVSALHPLGQARSSPASHEPSLFYDPPYATAADDQLAWHLVKYLGEACGLRYQVPGPRTGGPSIHFLIEHPYHRVGLMYRNGEDVGWARLGDALLMGTGAVDVLYRLRVMDTVDALHDILYLITQWDGALFSERGRINLKRLASPVARSAQVRPIDTTARLQYGAEGGVPLPSASMVVQRLSQRHPAGWMPAYEQARHRWGSPAVGQRWARSA